MKDKYTYLEHTADAKFQAFGKDLEEAFINAGYATFNILISPGKVKPVVKKDINVKAKKKESLLYDYLEEMLFLLDTEGFLLSRIDSLKIEKQGEEYALTAIITGDSFKNYKVGGNIKSVTYNDMFIKEEKGKVTLQVVLDL